MSLTAGSNRHETAVCGQQPGGYNGLGCTENVQSVDEGLRDPHARRLRETLGFHLVCGPLHVLPQDLFRVESRAVDGQRGLVSLC